MKTRQGKKIKILLVCLLCTISTSLSAQQTSFKYKANLPKVDSAGYYRINLQPGLTSKAKMDLSDVRIVDADEKDIQNQVVAFIKAGDIPVYPSRDKWIEFCPVPINGRSDTSTVFVVGNTTGQPIHSLKVYLKNTVVERHITLNGSDDLKQWFAIKENMPLGTSHPEDEKGEYEQDLEFPVSNYRYLKLIINNEHKSPLNILRAGISTYVPVATRFTAIPLKLNKVDSANHITHLYIGFNEPTIINKLNITVALNAYFQREVNVYTNDAQHQLLTSKTLSNHDTEINLSVKTTGLDVQIVNNDNRPLQITKVDALQSQNYIVGYLEAGHKYELFLGDTAAKTPDYDIKYFSGKINTPLPELAHNAIEANPIYKFAATKPAKQYPFLLWLSVGLAVVVLSVLTFRMAKEVGNK
jgi:hypothetical protein